MLAKRIEAWENALPPYLKLAYLPNPGAVRLRLSAYEVEGESVAREIERQFEALRRLIPHNVIGYETATMQELVHRILTERGKTLATAESCTGGAIASRFTAMPGASAYFRCGVVSYSNESKAALLGVDPATIARVGAVSGRWPARWPKGCGAWPAPTMPSPRPASRVPREARPRSPSARYGSPWQPPREPRPSADSAERTAGRSSTAPRPSPSQCSAMRWSLPEGSLSKRRRSGTRRGTTAPCGLPQRGPGSKKRALALLIAEKVVYLHSLKKGFTSKQLHEK